jgi:hypothetical protein
MYVDPATAQVAEEPKFVLAEIVQVVPNVTKDGAVIIIYEL